MLRSLTPVLCLFLGVASLSAQDLGRTDRLWRMFLSETVRRGLPLLGGGAPVVPYWPDLDRARAEAETLEPGADAALLGAWVDLAEGQSPSLNSLRDSWPRPVSRFSSRWGETLFAVWNPEDSGPQWVDAWLAWPDKAYNPRALIRGIQVLEKFDPSAVLPLLTQASQLYPEDRRFLPLVARHPEAVVSPEGLLARDRADNGGWSSAMLREVLSRKPDSRALLLKAGYTEADVAAAQARDYGAWLASGADKPPGAGTWSWDSDADGFYETTLIFQDSGLASWSRRGSSLWTLSFQSGQPDSLTETRSGASWVLKWESYPWASVLEYHWGNRKIVYRFRPLAQAIPLWPSERFQAPLDRLPAALVSLWLPLDPRALAAAAATVETWDGPRKLSTVFLYQGEVWLEAGDSNQDGRDDTWSYFRAGRLASVYHDPEGRGQAGLRELYQKGELNQVQSRGSATRNEFVLFPQEGVQLWDPHTTGTPLERLFVWSGEDKLGALVFHQQTLPWETMPAWEARP